MSSSPVDVSTGALPRDPAWDLVDRIAASRHFSRSPKLRELLCYICERALQQRPEDLREQLIGLRVFGRKSDYNPGDDNIVRVEVRRLRKRLDDYFSAEGRDEPVIILIPKGSYLPVFQPRAVGPSADAPLPLRRSHWHWLVLAVSAVFALLGLWSWNQSRVQRELPGVLTSAGDRSSIWPLLFNPRDETRVVCADSSLVVAQWLRGSTVSLDDYIRRDYTGDTSALPEEVRRVLSVVPNWQLTDLADVRLVERLHRLNYAGWDRTSIRSARTVQSSDFTTGNSVLLGSLRSNPWNRLFDQQLNFQVDFDDRTRTAFVRNRLPLPGEQPVYRAETPGNPDVVYSTIAFIPNLRRTGHVLIIAGTSGQATETAGEYITTPSTYSALIDAVKSRSGGELPYFQVLLKAPILAGVVKDARILAIRTMVPGPRAG